MECSVSTCDRPAAVKSLCRACYANEWQKKKRREEWPESLLCSFCDESYTPKRYAADSGRNRFCSRECKDKARHQTPEFKAEQLRRYYRRRYQLTVEEVESMRERGCDICGRTEAPGRWVGNMHIDHDHDTGSVRGVLCHGCNVSIGHFKHDPALLRRAADYLDR